MMQLNNGGNGDSVSNSHLQRPSHAHGNVHHSQDLQYTAWSSNSAPVSRTEIYVIFNHLKDIFGFQKDNMLNMFDHLMVELDSRASRMVPSQALITLHADYIGGENANYRKWYFASGIGKVDSNSDPQDRWNEQMNTMSQKDRVRQLALWLLLWGEASQVRFMSECLCFIFKLADDYCKSQPELQPVLEGEYLRNVIKPLYNYIRDQSYEVISGKLVKREKDHAGIIGYDDINQFFWYSDMIDSIVLKNEQSIMDLDPGERYLKLRDVNWDHVFIKIYKERRTWLHLVVNFTRIWIIHVAIFWYYTSYNAPFLKYKGELQWSVVALGGVISTFIMIIAHTCEYFFITSTGSRMARRLLFLLFLFIVFIINSSPFYSITHTEQMSLKLGMIQFTISLITILMFTITPSYIFNGGPSKDSIFTSNYAQLSNKDRTISIVFWCCVFGCKLVESYFFLSFPFRSSLEIMFKMRDDDILSGSTIRLLVPVLAIIIMYLTTFVLFLSDTYPWYVIWNTIFSSVRSFTPGKIWQNIFATLPKNICTNILALKNLEINLVSQIWDAIIDSMYHECLLSNENAQKLLYRHRDQQGNGEDSLNLPAIFANHNDSEQCPLMGEAERRITFFAQSLSTITKDPLPIEKMPTFTVLTPHYSEKILLSPSEISSENTRVNLLEYLKKMHQNEWENFLAGEDIQLNPIEGDNLVFEEGSNLSERIWASFRTQTLFRTISGFMNYSKAIKLLYRVKNQEKPENEIASMARRKFKLLISMQRYSEFNEEEQKNVDFLLRAYPDLHIAYLEKDPPKNGGDETEIFSVLINGYCEKSPINGKREPIYRIKLPGDPILGDGKADNQNLAIIFYRGEYLQLIDANQDNYFEECLKIPNILGEFEQYNTNEEPSQGFSSMKDDFSRDTIPSTSQSYDLDEVSDEEIIPESDKIRIITSTNYSSATETSNKIPISIVGAGEYIFTRNYGVLGDIVAGRMQAFGTSTQSMMAKVGGRLHYGHPDFMNAIFMTTRGGISKAQKGLHLNEDIYAGINSFNRGGYIKHSDYIQYGKGRDLGFESILNFVTKTSTGMGEQMLSREYYYLGTQLALDRFLTFYYAHPSFHLNNVFIMLSFKLLMFSMMFIGAMRFTLPVCGRDNLQGVSCYDLTPITDWIKYSIILIIFASFINFLPSFSQELIEGGLVDSLIHLGKHFVSLSPFFEVFTVQISSNSLITNLNFGGARYIPTGRGLATERISFYILYTRFAGPSIYYGMRNLPILLFVTLEVWVPHLVYIWVLITSLYISPFLFNPHQFSFSEFIIDYYEFLRWMLQTSETRDSWIDYCYISTTMITNYKLGDSSKKSAEDSRPHFTFFTFLPEILESFVSTSLCIIVFMFVKSFDSIHSGLPNTGKSTVICLCAIALGPILMNAVGLAGLFIVSLFLRYVYSGWFNKFGAIITFIARGWAIINFITIFEISWIIESRKLENAILVIITITSIQRFVIKVMKMIITLSSRDYKYNEMNRAWWTGRWQETGSGLLQPFREYIYKINEMTLFAKDFVSGHIILFTLAPICFIPWINKWHFIMLFWLKPDEKIRPPIIKQNRDKIWIYGILFFVMFIIFVGLIIGPIYISFEQIIRFLEVELRLYF